jgi:hypothetical protein
VVKIAFRDHMTMAWWNVFRSVLSILTVIVVGKCGREQVPLKDLIEKAVDQGEHLAVSVMSIGKASVGTTRAWVCTESFNPDVHKTLLLSYDPRVVKDGGLPSDVSFHKIPNNIIRVNELDGKMANIDLEPAVTTETGDPKNADRESSPLKESNCVNCQEQGQ